MLSLSLMHCNKANSLEATWVMLNSNHVLPLVCFAIWTSFFIQLILALFTSISCWCDICFLIYYVCGLLWMTIILLSSWLIYHLKHEYEQQ